MNREAIPDKINGFRSEVINALIECVTALWPEKSATLLVNVKSGGTSYEVKRPGRGGGGGGSFSGTAYVAGNKTTGLDSDTAKLWVRCFLDTGTCEENAGPPPNPQPYNEEWYEKANTYGDIHITRA